MAPLLSTYAGSGSALLARAERAPDPWTEGTLLLYERAAHAFAFEGAEQRAGDTFMRLVRLHAQLAFADDVPAPSSQHGLPAAAGAAQTSLLLTRDQRRQHLRLGIEYAIQARTAFLFADLHGQLAATQAIVEFYYHLGERERATHEETFLADQYASSGRAGQAAEWYWRAARSGAKRPEDKEPSSNPSQPLERAGNAACFHSFVQSITHLVRLGKYTNAANVALSAASTPGLIVREQPRYYALAALCLIAAQLPHKVAQQAFVHAGTHALAATDAGQKVLALALACQTRNYTEVNSLLKKKRVAHLLPGGAAVPGENVNLLGVAEPVLEAIRFAYGTFTPGRRGRKEAVRATVAPARDSEEYVGPAPPHRGSPAAPAPLNPSPAPARPAAAASYFRPAMNVSNSSLVAQSHISVPETATESLVLAGSRSSTMMTAPTPAQYRSSAYYALAATSTTSAPATRAASPLDATFVPPPVANLAQVAKYSSLPSALQGVSFPTAAAAAIAPAPHDTGLVLDHAPTTTSPPPSGTTTAPGTPHARPRLVAPPTAPWTGAIPASYYSASPVPAQAAPHIFMPAMTRSPSAPLPSTPEVEEHEPPRGAQAAATALPAPALAPGSVAGGGPHQSARGAGAAAPPPTKPTAPAPSTTAPAGDEAVAPVPATAGATVPPPLMRAAASGLSSVKHADEATGLAAVHNGRSSSSSHHVPGTTASAPHMASALHEHGVKTSTAAAVTTASAAAAGASGNSNSMMNGDDDDESVPPPAYVPPARGSRFSVFLRSKN